MKQIKKHPLIIGTIILTATGLISRLIGFYYRIYLTRLFGEEGMGIYQLLSPVLALSFSLTAAGYQTAISKFVAERTAESKSSMFRPMLVGLSISLPLSLLCNAVIFFFADFIGTHLLLETRTASMLRILSFSIPLGAVHSCINGYFYGKKKTAVPALSQLVEQLARVGCVYFIAAYALNKGQVPTINVAVLGLTFGEFVSMLVSVTAIYLTYVKEVKEYNRSNMLLPASNSLKYNSAPCTFKRKHLMPVYRSILGMALPLTANRIILNILQSIESVSIPAKLRLYGYDTSTALSVYGVLTGMALPLIFFPNALTGSVAVLLLPIISENNAKGNREAVNQAVLRTIKYCGLLGLGSMCIFGLLGNHIGILLFDSALAGHFISTLGFICPFMYLDTTLSSILQGLGKAGSIFTMNVISLLVRLLFVFTAIPTFGITGYLWGLLASQLLQSILYLTCLWRTLKSTQPIKTLR
uniref:oligosaccharide flippase family protein n=1 Tax=Acetatifactor sp. TaxID=1872090 RepID=UPI00405619D7